MALRDPQHLLIPGDDAIAPVRWQLACLLNDAMTADGWTQTDMARAIGLSRKHVYNLLAGESGTVETYDLAAHILDRRWVVSLTPPERPDEHVERVARPAYCAALDIDPGDGDG